MNKLTKQQTLELHQLASLPDALIDTSDIPEQTHWDNATVGRFYANVHHDNVKQELSALVRLDADIVSAFKATGTDWQSCVNNALREWLSQQTSIKTS